MKKQLIFFLILLFLVTPALALKASSRVVINFEPGLEYQGKLCIIPEATQYLELRPEGVLADRIELPARKLDLSGGPRCIPYNVTLPEKFERPGIQKTVIWVEEAPKNQFSQISAKVRIGHQFWVDVPYPGKYLEIRLQALNTEAGEPVYFQAIVTSKGEETINFIKGRIQIYNWEDKLVGEVETDTFFNLESQQSTTLHSIWNSTGNVVGDYHALLLLEYDGIEDNATTNFKLGSLEVRLKDYTKKVYKKGIVPFNMFVESYWSQLIERVNAHIQVLNGSSVLTEFDTLTKDIAPWKEENLLGYLDTTELGISNYTLQMTLYYNQEEKNYEGVLEVAEEPKPVVEKPGLTDYLGMYFHSTKALLISTIIFALIALIIVLRILLGGKEQNV